MRSNNSGIVVRNLHKTAVKCFVLRCATDWINKVLPTGLQGHYKSRVRQCEERRVASRHSLRRNVSATPSLIVRWRDALRGGAAGAGAVYFPRVVKLKLLRATLRRDDAAAATVATTGERRAHSTHTAGERRTKLSQRVLSRKHRFGSRYHRKNQGPVKVTHDILFSTNVLVGSGDFLRRSTWEKFFFVSGLFFFIWSFQVFLLSGRLIL